MVSSRMAKVYTYGVFVFSSCSSLGGDDCERRAKGLIGPGVGVSAGPVFPAGVARAQSLAEIQYRT